MAYFKELPKDVSQIYNFAFTGQIQNAEQDKGKKSHFKILINKAKLDDKEPF